jgi:hypothetical protein
MTITIRHPKVRDRGYAPEFEKEPNPVSNKRGFVQAVGECKWRVIEDEIAAGPVSLGAILGISHAASVGEIERKFERLRDRWKSERGPHSNIAKLTMHDAYQSIIGMGEAAVPLLLKELQNGSTDYWYWALQAITEQDPIPFTDAGNAKKMSEAWVEWGKRQGYLK